MIRVENLSAAYAGGIQAFKGISFQAEAKENLALVGANGAGKTSLLLALVGILPFDSGEVVVDGLFMDPKNLDAFRRKVGLVFQNPEDQLFMPSIYEDLVFGPRNLGLSEEDARRRAEDALALLGISRLHDRSPLKMSGGEKRLAAIATVLTMRPLVMLFDEPTAYLDPRARRSLITALKPLPHTKIIATHDLAFATEVCGRALVLKEGILCAQGNPRDLFADTALMEECGLAP
ncbi:MAG: energy-coupling factor ABC transporter ATP-binding protein [Treponema sp.]|jgi:cobalt/nickel transport system ATP-binding protein|nr:energy-coupling factor ABC transporter ATP-binding protein [Treponema sp.]